MRNGQLDAVHSSTKNFVDEIILSMHRNKVLQCLEDGIPDKRADNTTIPFGLTLTLAATAKMKTKTSVTDIPFAITDSRALAELGFTLHDPEGNLGKGLMRESSLRAIIEKYAPSELFINYNNTVQDYIMPKLDLSANIHILDCTKLEVNFSNKNYELAGVVSDNEDNKSRGYKLSTLRGIIKDTGIIEDARFGAINVHDSALSEDILYNSPVLKYGDIIINDRGFISREHINYLKSHRGVDTYIPLKTNMPAYEMAISTAQYENKWMNHPNKKRINQKIAFVSNLGGFWEGDNPKDDVDFNACVVWNTKPKTVEDKYAVFITTDLEQSAKYIIRTYELRPEIEEDYRQLKDFWQLDEFTSTKLTMIAFHIICVLFGYLFFQIYTILPEGEKYFHKCLPVILKNYTPEALNFIVFYIGYEFGIFSLIEFADLYSECNDGIRQKFKNIMGTG